MLLRSHENFTRTEVIPWNLSQNSTYIGKELEKFDATPLNILLNSVFAANQ